MCKTEAGSSNGAVGCLVAAVHAWLVLLRVRKFVPFVAMPGLCCFLRVTLCLQVTLLEAACRPGLTCAPAVDADCAANRAARDGSMACSMTWSMACPGPPNLS